jgi:surfactin synthase thioesterase subunit
MSQPSRGNDPWCRRYRPGSGATARLVCLPHAGGSAPFFLPVAAALSPNVDVVAIQYPGRQDRRTERPIADLMTLADGVYEALRGQPEMPLTIFGHSLGALVGFEVIRRFEADGQTPSRLFASGRRGPATYRDERVHLGDDAYILAEVRSLNGTASAVLDDEELMRATLPALRADYQAAETYVCAPETTVNCPISVLTGDSDAKTTVAEARAWAGHTTGSFDLHVFAGGGHFFITDQADKVMQILTRHFEAERAHAGASSVNSACEPSGLVNS